MANIAGTNIASTGNATVDNSIAALQQATTASEQLNLQTTVAVTQIQGENKAVSKLNPQ